MPVIAPFDDSARLSQLLATAPDPAAITAIMCAWCGLEDELAHALIREARALDAGQIRFCLSHRVRAEAIAEAPGITPEQRTWIDQWAIALVESRRVTESSRRFGRDIVAEHAKQRPADNLSPAQESLLDIACSGKSAGLRTKRQSKAMIALLASLTEIPDPIARKLGAHVAADHHATELLKRADIPLDVVEALILPASLLENVQEPHLTSARAWELGARATAFEQAPMAWQRYVLTQSAPTRAALVAIARSAASSEEALRILVRAGDDHTARQAWHILKTRTPGQAHAEVMEHPLTAGRCMTGPEIEAMLNGERIYPDYGFPSDAYTRTQLILAAGGLRNDSTDVELDTQSSAAARLVVADDPEVIHRVRTRLQTLATRPPSQYSSGAPERMFQMAAETLVRQQAHQITLSNTLEAISANLEQARHAGNGYGGQDIENMSSVAFRLARSEWASVMLSVWVERSPQLLGDLQGTVTANRALVRAEFSRAKRGGRARP